MCAGLYITAALLSEAGEQELEDHPGDTVHLFWVRSHGREFGDGDGKDDKESVLPCYVCLSGGCTADTLISADEGNPHQC